MKQVKHSKLLLQGKRVDIYPGAAPNSPIIYLNTVSAEGEAVRQETEKMKCPDFSLVSVSGLEWNHDMSPWNIPPISGNDTPCTGGADDYLRFLLHEIVPRVEKSLPEKPCFRGLAGYSLAGLFAVYAMYQTDLFSRIAAISGSFWFPGFKEYAMSHPPKKWPEHLYFSLGDKEGQTRNPYLKAVQANTEELTDFYRRQQINTTFHTNPGNHFTETAKRSAHGIQWLLSR
ncbi:MAG: alpha/beta hydrolase-fold protein [Roseburia sp.]|nr:alpha/beta hydrolase-fold protein [Roseburia sp.]